MISPHRARLLWSVKRALSVGQRLRQPHPPQRRRNLRGGNSLSHLMLALSASLQEGNVAADAVTFCDASLEAFGLMSRGRMMSILVQARRQVWLSQSSLTEAARRTLRSLPVEPGGIFGPAAQEALERTIQAGQTRQQLAGLRRMPPPDRPPTRRPSAPSPAFRTRLPPPSHFTGHREVQYPIQRQQPGTFRVPPACPPDNLELQSLSAPPLGLLGPGG